MISALSLLTRDVLEAAPGLLGWELLSHTEAGTTGGIIVETEAYRGSDDPAAHSFRGKTARNAPLWEGGGVIYVYLSYGLHTMMNFAAGKGGIGEGILIRALEPTVGMDLMAKRRGTTELTKLTSGPAKLTQALGIMLNLSGSNLSDGVLTLNPPTEPIADITHTTRIGISQGKELPWRFYVSGSPYISRR